MSLRRVLYAQMQSNVFIPGAGDLGKTLPNPSKTLVNLTMHANENDNLEVSFTYNHRSFKGLIKDATIMSFAIEATPAPVLPKATK